MLDDTSLGNASALTGAVASLARDNPEVWQSAACGVTRSLNSIPALVERGAYLDAAGRVKVVLVGGLSGDRRDANLALEALRLFAQDWERLGVKIALSAAPAVNVDGLLFFNHRGADQPARNLGGAPGQEYPPADGYYFDADAPETRYLWRWVCFQCPHLVLELRHGDGVRWDANNSVGMLPFSAGASPIAADGSLTAALGTNTTLGLGPIPGLRLTTDEDSLAAELNRIWEAVLQARVWRPGPAATELEQRRSRRPLEVGRILASVYGHGLEPVIYTKGVAISGRLQLAALAGKSRDSVAETAPVVEPFLSGASQPLAGQPGGSTLGGLVWAYDLARDTGDRRAHNLLVEAAGHFQPRGAGEAPAPADPDFRVEDMFFAGAILGRAFRLTGDSAYNEILAAFLEEAGVQQDDGLFWHARSAPYLWGRGNGFAALGFAEALTYLPGGHPRRTALLEMHLRHLDALRGLQLPTGMYPQLLDVPGSYGEFTSTAMIGCAMARGLRRGWLDSSYRASVDAAWRGINERIDSEGNVVDACISTGVQQSVEEYLHRPAVNGFDDRSGSLGLWFAAEMERLRRDG